MTVTTSLFSDFVGPGEQFMNTLKTGNQFLPQVSANALRTEYFGAWSDPNNGFQVEGRVLGSDLTPVSNEFTINSANNTGLQFFADVAGLTDGSFVTVYSDFNADPGGDIRAVIYNSFGAQHSPDFAIDASAFDDSLPEVAALSDGGFVVTWTRDLGGGNLDIHAGVFNGDGSPRLGPEINGVRIDNFALVDGSQGQQTRPDVAGLANGNFVVVWQDDSNHTAYFRLFNSFDTAVAANRVPIDGTGTITQDVRVVGLSDGGFAVAFTDNGWGISGTEITFQIFNANGMARTGFIRANNVAFGGTETGDQDHPTITTLDNGMIVVGWQDEASTITFAQVFDTAGNAIGTNQEVGAGGIVPNFAGLSGGQMAVVMSSAIPDGAGNGTSIITSVIQFHQRFFSDTAGDALVGLNDGLPQVFVGLNGNHTFVGGNAGNEFDADGANNTVSYATAAAGVTANLSNASLNAGTAAHDTYSGIQNLIGSAFNDTLIGDNGANVLRGGAGSDHLTGNAGADSFVFDQAALTDATAAHLSDTITDFDQGANGTFNAPEGDQIDLSALLSTAFAHGNGQSVDHLVRLVSDGHDATLQIDADGLAGGTKWTTIATLDGIHVGNAANVILDASLPAGQAITAVAEAQDLPPAPTFEMRAFGSSVGGGGWTSDDQFPRLLADVNGDGMADIIGFGFAGANVALATGGGSFGSPSLALDAFGAANFGGGWTSEDQFPRAVADVNGDGMADIVGFGIAGVTVALATGGGHFAPAAFSLGAFGSANSAGGWASQDQFPRVLADVNGDGMADVVGFGNAGVSVALATGGGHFGTPSFVLDAFGAANSAGGWSSENQLPRMLADVNGDGMADIVGFGFAGVTVALATGGGHFAAPVFTLPAFGSANFGGGWSTQDQFPRALADVNGDGMADIVGFGIGGTTVAFATGGGHFAAPMFALAAFGSALGAGGWTSQDAFPRALADLNGDGFADIVGFGIAGVTESPLHGLLLG